MLSNLEIIGWKKFRGQPKLDEAVGRVQFGCQRNFLNPIMNWTDHWDIYLSQVLLGLKNRLKQENTLFSIITQVIIEILALSLAKNGIIFGYNHLQRGAWNTTSMTELHWVSKETKIFPPFVRLEGFTYRIDLLCIGLSGSWRWTDTCSCTSCTKW